MAENEEKIVSIWVDPPSGWRYGFPKLYIGEMKNVSQWIEDNGYPVKKEGLHFYRCWEATEKELCDCLTNSS